MTRRLLPATMVMAAAMFASSAVYAAPMFGHSDNAKLSHAKLVSLTLRNESKAPMKIMAGNNEVTLRPGEALTTKLAVGDKIVAEQATEKNAAGTVLAVVSKNFSGATLGLH